MVQRYKIVRSIPNRSVTFFEKIFATGQSVRTSRLVVRLFVQQPFKSIQTACQSRTKLVVYDAIRTVYVGVLLEVIIATRFECRLTIPEQQQPAVLRRYVYIRIWQVLRPESSESKLDPEGVRTDLYKWSAGRIKVHITFAHGTDFLDKLFFRIHIRSV